MFVLQVLICMYCSLREHNVMFVLQVPICMYYIPGVLPEALQECIVTMAHQVQMDVAAILAPHLTPDGLVVKCLEFADSRLEHVMDFTRMRALSSLFALFNQAVRNVLQYNNAHTDFPMQSDQLERLVVTCSSLILPVDTLTTFFFFNYSLTQFIYYNNMPRFPPLKRGRHFRLDYTGTAHQPVTPKTPIKVTTSIVQVLGPLGAHEMPSSFV